MNVAYQIVGIGSSLRFQICGTHGRKIMLCIFSDVRYGVASEGTKNTSKVSSGVFVFPLLGSLITISDRTLCHNPKEGSYSMEQSP